VKCSVPSLSPKNFAKSHVLSLGIASNRHSPDICNVNNNNNITHNYIDVININIILLYFVVIVILLILLILLMSNADVNNINIINNIIVSNELVQVILFDDQTWL